jgi:hypothetical protein
LPRALRGVRTVQVTTPRAVRTFAVTRRAPTAAVHVAFDGRTAFASAVTPTRATTVDPARGLAGDSRAAPAVTFGS